MIPLTQYTLLCEAPTNSRCLKRIFGLRKYNALSDNNKKHQIFTHRLQRGCNVGSIPSQRGATFIVYNVFYSFDIVASQKAGFSFMKFVYCYFSIAPILLNACFCTFCNKICYFDITMCYTQWKKKITCPYYLLSYITA